MYICSTVIKLLHPYLDRELDVKEAVRVQTHLQECPYCYELFSAEQAFQNLVRQDAEPPPAPEFARQCVTAALSRESRRPRLQRLHWRPARIAAGAGAVAAAAALVMLLVGGFTTPVPGLVTHAVAQHRAYLDHPDSLDVTGGDIAVVAARLEERLHFNLRLPTEPVADLRLIGGRVVEDGDRLAAHLVYRLGDRQTVSLLMTTPQEVRMSGRNVIAFKNILFHPADVAGYQTLQWSDRLHTYVLVSSEPGAVYQACVICHGSGRSRDTIAGFTSGT